MRKHQTHGHRWQDFLFHKLTLGFALLVLLVLMGILVALMVGA
ncbi:MAG: phosphate ABC transporter permease subunit PstC, partial [Oxalobacter sp.]